MISSAVVTLALLYALEGCGQRAFWCWLVRDYRPLFPNLPHRTRLFRLFNLHQHYIAYFLADPSIVLLISVFWPTYLMRRIEIISCALQMRE
jgi:hypothetical protein